MAIRCLLIVEDDDAFVGILADVLYEHLGGRVSLAHARTVEESLPILSHEPIDVAIVDLGLPGAHELSAVHQIRSHAPLVPILILTGCDDPILQRRAEQMVAVEWIHKGGMLHADDLVSQLHLLDYCRRLLRAAQEPENVPCVHRDGDHAPLRPWWQDRAVQTVFVAVAIILGGLSYWMQRQDKKMDDIDNKLQTLTVQVEQKYFQVVMNKLNIEDLQRKSTLLERWLQWIEDTLKKTPWYPRRERWPDGIQEGTP